MSRTGGRASRGECRGVTSEGLRVVGSVVEWRAGAYVRGECRGVVGDRARWWSGVCVCVVGRCGECRGVRRFLKNGECRGAVNRAGRECHGVEMYEVVRNLAECWMRAWIAGS